MVIIQKDYFMKLLKASISTWMCDLPIRDPINYQMALLLQVILLGLITIFFIASISPLLLPTSDYPIETYLIRFISGSMVFGIPWLLLRKGFYRSAIILISAMFILLIGYAAFTTNLRSIAENLTFLTLAILLVGLLVGKKSLILVFVISIAILFSSAFLEVDPSIRSDDVVISINFMLLNGLITIFIDAFGITLRQTLRSALEREAELKVEIENRKQAEEEILKLNATLETRVQQSAVLSNATVGASGPKRSQAKRQHFILSWETL
jgi:hypothetical protein